MTDSGTSTHSPETKKENYKETLSLPQTEFKMKAGAATREPEIEAMWDENKVYEKALALRDKTKKFVLHDGPPYLSSDKIHIGTALNKVLKDIVTRYKYQRGYYSPYVPGYDSHGLPIENAVVKKIKGGRKAVTPVELRQKCREFALKNLDGQETNFKRLGVWGNWEQPYLTMDAHYEATQAKLFGKMFQDGHVYKGLKPVYWCASCETALADAEVEYDDHTSHSIYVKFKYLEMGAGSCVGGWEGFEDDYEQLESASFVIWTTTPWTLPANLALSVHPDFNYKLIQTEEHGKLVVVEELLETFTKHIGGKETPLEYTELLTFKGKDLELALVQHPFIEGRKVPVLCGTHVTTEAGTGVVHTAPGHGSEDYVVCQRYNNNELKDNPIATLSPLDNRGVFTEACETPELVGEFYEKANDKVLEILRSKNALLGHSKYDHSFPHCWRCHNPVIYRATDQWFINVNDIRDKALAAIKDVTWIPERGESRLGSMVEGRTDWCISRQRVWGLPIPVFSCADEDCREPLLNDDTLDKIYNEFAEHTSDIWWDKEADYFLEGKYNCAKCNGKTFNKEMDIMDVWFDSGVSHTVVVDGRKDELGELPVELYLEGSDQHRGWFQSALWTSVMLNGKAPYKQVLTHGFVLDEKGKKMSKSLGNVVDPNDIIRQFGADVLRLWVASVDYTNDMKLGKNSIQQLTDVYKKVRNTVRFILGNLHGFDPTKDAVPYAELSELDQYTLHRVQDVVKLVTDAFDQFEFHRYYQTLQNFCVVDLSQLYFDAAKDILYCDPADSKRRCAIQTVLFELLKTIVPLLVPVMPHMAEDIWLTLPKEHRFGDWDFVALSDWPTENAEYRLSAEALTRFETMLAVRDDVNMAIEAPRSEGQLGSSLEAGVVLYLKDADKAFLKDIPEGDFAAFCITSQFCVVENQPTSEALKILTTEHGYDIYVYKANGDKCLRCWMYDPIVGHHEDESNLCGRCHSAVNA